MRKSVLMMLFTAITLWTMHPVWAQETERKNPPQEINTVPGNKDTHNNSAITIALKALNVAENTYGPNHPNVATSLYNLAELYRIQGQYAQAEPLYRRSLAIREDALDPEHPDVATSLY